MPESEAGRAARPARMTLTFGADPWRLALRAINGQGGGGRGGPTRQAPVTLAQVGQVPPAALSRQAGARRAAPAHARGHPALAAQQLGVLDGAVDLPAGRASELLHPVTFSSATASSSSCTCTCGARDDAGGEQRDHEESGQKGRGAGR